ncbi:MULTISPECIES: hypothetical protein [unclassified Curtobacterium]|uniref:hypothetical protein n=1 Tax=unclassified Curtobacterium TaxID=257496 RepID=UPI000F4C7BC8|nr:MULTISPECIES: hypothetical protein [unclassified Curtobacterium]ROP65117.1 hypothetical protein EDF55_1771 [Curtobacterium sp. ZW137]TCK65384.1 hypothetical protein EDF27_0122 [Curtobacterium sp. PhB136]
MKHTPWSHRTALVAAALVICTLPFTVAACSTSTGTDTVADASAGIGAKWGSCMRDAGFDVKDPSDAAAESGMMQAPSGADGDEFTEAGATCRKQAGIAGHSKADMQKWERESAEVASCLRENGYADFPEQKPGVIDLNGYARAQEPAFQEVMQECTDEFAPDTQTQDLG